MTRNEMLDDKLESLLGCKLTVGDWQLVQEEAKWDSFEKGSAGVVRSVSDKGRHYWVMAYIVPSSMVSALTHRDSHFTMGLLPWRPPSELPDTVVFWAYPEDLHPSQHLHGRVPLLPSSGGLGAQMRSPESMALISKYRQFLREEAENDEYLDELDRRDGFLAS